MAAAGRARQDGLSCSVPLEVCETSISCSGSPILKRDLVTSKKMLCSSGSCNQSGFLHASCLHQVEDILIRQISNNSAGSFGNLTSARLQRKSYNWENPADREKLWKDGGGGHMYSLICRRVKCCCGKGLVRRDLTWPPTQWRGAARKVPALPLSSRPLAPTVRVSGQGSIQYQPAVAQLPDFVRESGQVGIPGAVFPVPGERSKQGVIVKWVGGREGWGQVRNEEREERMCLVRGACVEGEVGNWEGLEGSKVEYTTRRRGKKLEAVNMKLKVRDVETASKVKRVLEKGARTFEQDQEMKAGQELLDLSSLQEVPSIPEHLHRAAARLERENLLLSPEYTSLVLRLMQTKNLRVCSIVFNRISGLLSRVLQDSPGLAVVQSLLQNGTTLQVELLVEELCQAAPQGGLPLVVLLVLNQQGHGILEATVRYALQEQLLKVRGLFELWGARLGASPYGAKWFREVKMKIAADTREGGD